MIPGSVSRMSVGVIQSADKIAPKSEVVHLSIGAVTTVNTIVPPLGEDFSQLLIIIPNLAFTLGTAGNISGGIAAAQTRAVFLVWSRYTKKWYINSGV